MPETPAPTPLLQRLYDSEINVGLTSFWDNGWTVWIGDAMNGRQAEATVPTLAEAEAWLTKAARAVYPGSAFALAEAAAETPLETGD